MTSPIEDPQMLDARPTPLGPTSPELPAWADPTLFTASPQATEWGIFHAGKLAPMPLAEIVARVEAGPGVAQWHGGGERAEVVLVTRPESARPLAAVECPELQAAILRRDQQALSKARRKNGIVFYPLLAFTVLLDLGLHTFAILPAIFAMSTGAAHVEAWLTLNKLKSDPDKYLRGIAAQLRYAAWLTVSGVKHWCRTCAMLIIWLVIGCVEWFLPGPPGVGGEPGYIISAALVKSAIAAEPWRLLTATMLHGSIIHYIMNASAMFSLGLLLERGANRYLLTPVWLAGALAGSLLSWAGTSTTSVGASGGILAVFAFLLVMGQRRQSRLPPDFGSSLVRSLVMIAMLGLLAWGAIDNAAHLGGAIAGATIGYFVFRSDDGTLPLRDTSVLAAIGRIGDSLFVVAALFTMAKLLRII
ncbi:MAG: rhomboid family intramembrane serine protease [Betaproteobacteria bacterium]